MKRKHRLFKHKGMPSAALVSLLLAFLLLAGCSPSAPAPTQNPEPASAETPTPAPATSPTVPSEPSPAMDEEELLVYVPSYEALPLTMDPLTTRFPVESEEGVLFLRAVQTAESSGYQLMRGGKDAADAVTVISFAPEFYVQQVFPTGDGHAWLDRTSFQTGEIGLLEVALDSGDILREIPFPGENGSVTDLFDLPDGSLGVVTVLQTGAQALFSMTDDGSFIPVEAPLNESSNYLLNTTFVGTAGSGLPEGECLAYDKDSLFAFTPGSKEKRDLLHWSDWGISSFYTMPLGIQNGVLRLIDNRYREYVTLTPTPQSLVPVRQEITMACLTVQNAMETAICDFNRRSTEYFITIRDYSGGMPFTQDVMDQAITAMNLDIASGKMPDLLSMQDGVPFKSYAEKGLFLDLTPWLEGEGIELLPQILRAGSVDGKLFMVCGSFALLTAAGNRDYLGDTSGWTVAEAVELADSQKEGTGVFTSFMVRDRYMTWLSYYLEGFLDWNSGTASFDSQEFRDVLAFASSLPTEMPMGNTFDAEIMEGRALVNPTTIASINHWQYQDLIYMGKLAWVKVIYLHYLKPRTLISLVSSLLNHLTTLGTVAYVIWGISSGRIGSIGDYAALIAASTTLSTHLRQLFSCVTNIAQISAQAEQSREFFELPSVIEPSGGETPPKGPLSLELRDVSFAYPESDFCLKHLSLKIAPGEKIGIVGENGAGKSTLAKLLLRLYDADSGSVLYNGKPITEWDVHELRKRVGIAFQDANLYALTLRENLQYYNPGATDEQRLKALKTVGLDRLDDLDKTVSREFLEDGIMLSGGETQKLALARLLMDDFGLMILDEPSSALDPLAEYKMTKLMFDVSNTTTIMIAHRLSTIRDADRIYLISDGEVAEQGTHNELMALNGKYAEMFRKQAENYVA